MIVMGNYIVYCHTFPNDKKYIGVTCQDPNVRWNNGMGYKDQPFVFNAIVKYGWINIKHDVLYVDLSQEEAFFKEKELIALYHTNDIEYGYNLTPGGIFIPVTVERSPCSDQLKALHSLKTKESWLDPEIRNKRLLSMRAKCKEEQYRKNVSNGLKKRLENDENIRLKRSENMKNRMKDQSYKNRCLEALKQANDNKIKKRILDTQTGVIYESIKETSNNTGIGVSAISKQINGKTKCQRFIHLIKDKGGESTDEK